jgi:hypothetical protein
MIPLCQADVRFREEFAPSLSHPYDEGRALQEHSGELEDPSGLALTMTSATGDSRSMVRLLVSDAATELWIGGRLRLEFPSTEEGFSECLTVLRAFLAEQTVVALRRRSLFELATNLYCALVGRHRPWQPVFMVPARRFGGLLTAELLIPDLVRAE